MTYEEMVIKFKADMSEYTKSLKDATKKIKSISGVTDELKGITQKALGSASSEMQKAGKQLSSLIKTQTRYEQTAINSSRRVEEHKQKVKMLMQQLHEQGNEVKRLKELFNTLNEQYTAQKAYLNDWDEGVESVRKFRKEITDTLHQAAADSEAVTIKLNKLRNLGLSDNDDTVKKLTEELKGYAHQIELAESELGQLDNQLKAVGINPENLKSDPLKAMQTELQNTSREIRRSEEAYAKLVAQKNIADGALLTEQNRFESLNNTLQENALELNRVREGLESIGNNDAPSRQIRHFNGIRNVLSKIGSGASSAFGRLFNWLKKAHSATSGANKSLTGMVKSIKRIGVVALGLKLVRGIFGKLKSVVSEYLSQNEALNARVQALKASFANALAPAIEVVVALFEKLMPYALSVANAIGELMSSIGISSNINLTAGAIKNTAKATKQLSEAQGDLYGFDEITKVSDTGGSDSAATAVSASNQLKRYIEQLKVLWKSGDFEGLGSQIAGSLNSVIKKINDLDWEGLQTKVSNAMSGIARSMNGFIETANWNGMGETVGNVFNTLVSGLDAFLTNFGFSEVGAALVNFITSAIKTIKWKNSGEVIHHLAVGLLEFIESAFKTLADDEESNQTISNALKDFISGLEIPDVVFHIAKAAFQIARFTFILGENLLKDITINIGIHIADFSMSIAEWIDEHLAKPFHDWIYGDGENGPSWLGRMFSSGIYQGMTDWVIEKFEKLSNWLSEYIYDPLAEDAEVHSPSKKFARLGAFLAEGLHNGFVEWINGKINSFKEKGREIADSVMTKLYEGISAFKSKMLAKWQEVKSWFTDIKRSVSLSIVTKWSDLKDKWNSLKDKFTGKTEEITLKIKDLATKGLNSLISSLNSIIHTLKSVTIGGIAPFGGLREIPMLASGGVLKRGQVGFLEGDGDEAVVPLEKNTGWITKLAEMLISKTNQQPSGSQQLVIPIYIGSKKLTEIVIDDIDKTVKSTNNIPIRI